MIYLTKKITITLKGARNYYWEDKLLLSLPISLDLSSVLKNNVIDEDIFNEIIGNDLDKNRSANLFFRSLN